MKGSGSFPLGFHGDEGAHCIVKLELAHCMIAVAHWLPYRHVAIVVPAIVVCFAQFVMRCGPEGGQHIAAYMVCGLDCEKGRLWSSIQLAVPLSVCCAAWEHVHTEHTGRTHGKLSE